MAVWYVLATGEHDRFAEPEIVARKLMQYTYLLGNKNRPSGQTSAQFVREQLDELGLGRELTEIPWGMKKPAITLPPSRLHS